jgi:hypothetical protein
MDEKAGSSRVDVIARESSSFSLGRRLDEGFSTVC